MERTKVIRPVRRTHRRATWAVLCTVAMMGTAVVLLPPPTAASPKQAAEAAPAVATIKATARATSAIAAGAIATFDVSLINLGPAGETGPTSGPGAGDAAAPVTFTVTGLPDGATFDAATSTSPISEWACTPAAGGGVCTLVAKGTTQPTPLLGGDSAGAELEVHVPASASITGPVVAHVTAHAADGATAPDLTQASVDLPFAALKAGQAGSLGITSTTPPVVQVRRTSTGTITVRNLGPATIGGAGAPVQLTGLVPAAALQPYATGTGWKCKGLPLACQWAGDPIPVGGSLPPVTVGYTAPNTPTPADTPYEVTRTATAAVIAPGEIKPQGAATGTQLVEVSISPHPAPAVAVTARPVGSAGVEAPGQIKTEVAVTAASVDEKAQAIVVKASAPTGISFASVASSGPWRCASSAGAATCTRPGALAQGARSSFVLTWNVSAAAPAKGASVHVAASVAGEAAATLGDNQADVAYQITKAPVPTVSLRIWHYPASQPAIRQDGRLLRIATGTPTRFGIDAVNDGSATIPAGTDVKLSLQLPPGARTMTSTDLGAPAWRCRTAPTSSPKGTALVCTLRLLRAVTAGRALPRLRTYVTLPSNATVGVGHWYVRLSASQAGHPIPSLTTTTHKGVTVVRAPKLAAKPNLTMKLARAPRRTGRTGYLSVTFGNAGNAAAPSAFVLVSLPPGLRTTLPYPTGCARAPAGMAPVRAVCQIPAGLAPGKTTTRTLRITATSEAAPKGTARAEGRLGHGAPVEATTTVVALQPIDAKAHATPADVTSPAAGQPGAPVVLDGRTSVAVDATASWKQLRAPGDPAVTFKDVAAGSTRVDDLTARFATPVVTKTTKLHFLLTVTDGATSDATTVTVVVRPVPKLSTETDLGWGDPSQKDQATTSNSSADSYLWGWSTYPTVTRWNDVGYDSGPVFGSRIHFVAGADTPEAIWHGAEDQVPTVHSTQAFLVLCDTPHGDEGNSCDWPYPVGSLDRTITDPSARWAVRYQVIWTDSGGTDHTSWEDFPLMLRPGQWAWSWTIDVAPVPITDPGVSGSPSVGHLLTAHQGTWSLEFGFSYQWIRCTPGDAASCTDIPDATGATYEVQAADKGFELGVRVTADGLPVEEGGMGFTGTATAMVHPAVQDCATSCWTNDTPPTVSSTGAGGALVAGYPVTITDVGTWTWLDPANPPQDTTTTQGWRTCSATTPSDCTTTTGATYTPQVPGTTVTATVTRSSVNPATGTRVATVAEVPLGAVGAPAAPPALLGDPADQPAIQGDPTVGSTLTAFAGHWTYSLLRGGSDLDIAWYRCDTAPTPSCTDLHWSGPTYLVSAADQLATSHRLQVRVTAHGIDAAHDTTVASSPSGIVTATEKRLIAAPSFTAAGPFQVGTTLTRTPGTWSADPAASGPTVQWQRCTDIATPTCLNISGATSDTYTLATSDVGKWIRLREAYQSAGVPNPTYGHSDVAATQPVAPAQVALGVTLDPDSITLDLGASQTITAAATGGTAPYTYEWTHLGPSSVTSTSDGASITVTAPATGSGTATFTVTVTDDAGATASKTLTVDYHDLGAQVPPILCQLQTAVEVHGTTFALGTGMQLSIGGATASSGACGTGTTVDIANPHIELFGDITIAAQSVHIDNQGAHFTNVTLHVNDRALEGSNFSAASDLHITFAADDSQSSSIEVSGSVFADGIPFVQLPGGWRTREQVKFSVSGGSQSIELHAIAFPSANPLPTQHAGDPLPTPPEGAASVHLDGTFSYDQEHGAKLHLDAGTTNLIQVGNGAAINLTASFDRTPEEPVSFTASGSLSAPLELAPGARLAAADLEWDGTSFTGEGAVNLTSNGSTLSLGASFSFTDPNSWAAQLTVQSTDSWAPAPGFGLSNFSVVGSISRATVDDEVTTHAIIDLAVDTIDLGPSARIKTLHLSLDLNCAEDCNAVLSAGGALEVVLPTTSSGRVTVTVSGNLDLGKGTFDITGDLGQGFEAMKGVSVTGATLKVEGTEDGTSMTLTATGNVLGTMVAITIHLEADGSWAQATVTNWTPFDGAPTFQSLDVVYSKKARTVTLGSGKDLEVPADTVYLVADTTPPDWIHEVFHTDPTSTRVVVSGWVNLDSGDFGFDLAIELGNVEFEVDPVTMGLRKIALGMEKRGASVSFTVSADADLLLPPAEAGTPVDPLQFHLAATVNVTTSTLSGSLTLLRWDDAFGVQDLTVRNLTVAVSISPTSVVFGLGGTVTLPDAWGHEVGIVSGTPITLVAAIDVTAGAGSCFSFEIGEAGSTKTVIDVANAGAVTAKHAAFYLAPTGCQVGPFKIAAGFTIDFDGAIMGTPVHVGATVALDPFKVEAELSIGAFAVGGFELDHAHLQLLVSDTEQKVAFDAQATLFDASAKVSGEFHSSPDGVRVAFDGSFSTPDLGGFELKELTAHFLFTSGPPSSLSVAASADVKIMSAQVKANFSLEIVNGEFKGAHAEVENLEIGAPGDPIYVKGSAKIDIQPDTFPTIQIDGLLTASGRQLASAHLLVQPNGLAVTATLDIPGVFVVAPTISGTIAWDESSEDVPALKIKDRSGNEVDAKPGDFRFEVTDAAIQVEGVGVAGGVVIGYVGGVGWADMRADVHVAVGEVDLRVAFAGAIDTDGNFSLDGSGNLRLAGFDLANAKLHLVRQDGEVELSVDARLSIALATVELHGSLYRTPQGTMFELAGDAQIAPIRNYRLGATASFSLYRRPAGNGVVQGLSASTSLDLPTFSGSVGILITSDGVYSFSGNVAVRGTLGQALGWPRAQVDFYSSPSRTRLAFSASVANALGIPGRFSVDGAFDSSGRYSLNAVVAAGPWIWKLDIGICTIWAGAGGTFYLNIRGVGAVLEDARVGLDAWAGAGCGILSFSLAIDAGFWYQAPSTVHGTVRVVLDFGIFGQWKPVVYQM